MERRRIWLEGSAVSVTVGGPELIAHDGRRLPEAEAVYLSAGSSAEDNLRSPELPEQGGGVPDQDAFNT